MKPGTKLALLLAAWAAAAALFAAAGAFASLPRFGPPVLIGGLTIAFTLAALGRGSIGTALRSLGLRGLLALHLGRFVGFAFLWLEARGKLPSEFAERAGWGDIAAALGALLLLFSPRRGWVAAWAVFGVLDLAVAVGTAGWLNVVRPGSMAAIGQLPLALIPLFAVPVLAATGFLALFWDDPGRAQAPGGAARTAA